VGFSVDLLHRYSNQPDVVLERLRKVLNEPREHRVPTQKARQRQVRLSPGDRQKLIKAYESGLTIRELARAFGVNRKTASAILKRYGIDRHYRVLDAEAVREAAKLYSAGLSLQVVGDQFGVDASTVRKALRAAGVQTRPVGTNQWR
jgi:DNA invertase Pin-like site-specific DNA recombinase